MTTRELIVSAPALPVPAGQTAAQSGELPETPSLAEAPPVALAEAPAGAPPVVPLPSGLSSTPLLPPSPAEPTPLAPPQTPSLRSPSTAKQNIL